MTDELNEIIKTSGYLQKLKESDALKQEALALREQEKGAVIKAVKNAISLFGLTAHECGFGPKGEAKTTLEKGKTYKNPNGPETYEGRGKRPKWLNDALESGWTPGQLHELARKSD